MKTFTVTFHHTTNYGAILQAYALQQTLFGMNVNNEIFEYYHKESSYIKIDFKNPILTMKRFYAKFIQIWHRKDIIKKKKSFIQFHDKYLNLSRMYYSMDELNKYPPKVNVLITGSDQVWKFWDDSEFTPARFLDFGDKTIKRFSYAASIEQLNYSTLQKEYVKQRLKNYTGISVREQTAANYISSFTGYEVQRVIDPVFLLEKEKWIEISKKRKIEGPYILCYQVQSAPLMQKIVDELKRVTGYRTVAVIPYSTKWIKVDETLYDVTPEEFLAIVKEAEILIGASFHGVALGLVFEKIVYATARSNYSERIRGLMELFGIKSFFVDDTEKIPLPCEFELDKVKEIVFQERKKAFEFLERNLKE